MERLNQAPTPMDKVTPRSAARIARLPPSFLQRLSHPVSPVKSRIKRLNDGTAANMDVHTRVRYEVSPGKRILDFTLDLSDEENVNRTIQRYKGWSEDDRAMLTKLCRETVRPLQEQDVQGATHAGGDESSDGDHENGTSARATTKPAPKRRLIDRFMSTVAQPLRNLGSSSSSKMEVDQAVFRQHRQLNETERADGAVHGDAMMMD